MDFSLTPEQEGVVETAAKLFTGHLTDERRARVDLGGTGWDRDLWRALAGSHLLGLAVEERYGGSGLGFGEIAVLLEEAGRAAAPVPLWATLVLAGLPIARFGTDEQKERFLPPLAAGELIATAALVEPGTEPGRPQTTARPGPNGSWRLDGTKVCVPAGPAAQCFLVPARLAADEQAVAVFLVAPGTPGVTVTPLATTTGIPEARLDLAGVELAAASLLGDPGSGPEILHWILLHATSGLCSLMAGACRAALDLTAAYAVSRKQFERAIATFQAVGQRAADAYVDTEAVALTARQAAWRLAEGLPAEEHVAIAKFWAADGGQRVVHAAQHIHGGLGVDRSYPLHRHFLAAKQYELTLGGATASLLALGEMMAAEAV